MIKVFLSVLGLVLIAGASYHVCTEIGYRTAGSHGVTVEVTGRPNHGAVGQDYYARDGSKVLINGITRSEGPKHEIHVTVYGTHRYTLALFPPRWVHAFSMDQPAVEVAVRDTVAVGPALAAHPPHRRWHVLH